MVTGPRPIHHRCGAPRSAAASRTAGSTLRHGGRHVVVPGVGRRAVELGDRDDLDGRGGRGEGCTSQGGEPLGGELGRVARTARVYVAGTSRTRTARQPENSQVAGKVRGSGPEVQVMGIEIHGHGFGEHGGGGDQSGNGTGRGAADQPPTIGGSGGDGTGSGQLSGGDVFSGDGKGFGEIGGAGTSGSRSQHPDGDGNVPAGGVGDVFPEVP